MIRIWTISLSLFFGYLIGGPLGCVFGLIFGHFFANSYIRLINYQNKVKILYFKALFLILGWLCKADGVVSKAEIHATQVLFEEMELSSPAKRQAIDYFNQGLAGQFNLKAILDEMYTACHEQPGLLRLFIQTLFKVATVDGLNAQKKAILEQVCQRFGFDASIYYSQSENNYHKRENTNQSQQQQYTPSTNTDYALLEVPHDVSATELKRAYRKLMSQHHPDKLISKGLPDSMIKMATQKTQQIQAAYERIKRAKGY